MLVIKKIYQQFPQRVVEWGLSYILMIWGSTLLLKPGMFLEECSSPVYKGWESIAPQVVWGYVAVMVAMTRLACLYINGAHYKSPIARTVMGFFSMGIWFCATVGVFRSGISTAWCAYPMFMVGDAYALYVSSGDAFQSLDKEKKKGHVGNYAVHS